ncbi:MAG: ABC transporter ATP-binding protein [Deltaproteobacteria bacterium]|nr:ABC transporter ATP-binding protein [Deltaproteobacteria bacterium]
MNDHVVSTRSLTRTFLLGDVTVQALRGVDFDLSRGDFAAVAGPSGSGKTTLFNLIGGLDEPTSGEVFVDGRPLAGMSRRALSRLRLDKIGFVFQAYNLIPVLTAYENVEYPLLLKKLPARTRRARVGALLEAVGLADLVHRRPAQMSGGQQQRVAIARSLVCDPVVVLADEPTANVDSETGASLLRLMERLNRDQGITFLFSTHDPAVMKAARRLVRLKDGLIDTDVRQEGGVS